MLLVKDPFRESEEEDDPPEWIFISIRMASPQYGLLAPVDVIPLVVGLGLRREVEVMLPFFSRNIRQRDWQNN